MPDPVTVLAQYRVRSGVEHEFFSVLAQHWPALRALELVTDHPAQVYLGGEQGIDGPLVVELFVWATPDASTRAHTHPSVSAIWEAMEPLCEARDGRPSMEFS
ncbi:MAG: hypothetical protein ACRDJE_07870, partial [Dehalococcoidia bacterium]